MKYAKPLILLITIISTAFAENDLTKSAGCINAIKSTYMECLENNSKTACETHNSDKCQNILKDAISIKECKSLDTETLNSIKAEIGLQFYLIDLRCNTDENNEPCPLAKIYLDTTTEIIDGRETSNEATNETCKSKKCTDALISNVKAQLELRKAVGVEPKTKFDSSKIDKPYDGASVNDEDEIAYTLAFLESPFCTSQVSTTASADSKSSALTKYGSTVIAVVVYFIILIGYYSYM